MARESVRVFLLLGRLTVGAVFLLAGVPKILDNAAFLEALANYRLFPMASITLIGTVVPWLEASVGLGLLSGFFVRSAAILAGGLSLAFAGSVGSAVVRGLDIDCGCFSSESSVSWLHVAATLLLFGVSLWLALECRDHEFADLRPLAAVTVVCLLLSAGYLAFAASQVESFPSVPAGEAPRLNTDQKIDFGTMTQGEKRTRKVRLANTGKGTLVLADIKSSCGCTVAAPTQREIAPGEAAELEIHFDSGTRNGPFNKVVTIQSNDPESPHQIHVLGSITPIFEIKPEQIFFDELLQGEVNLTISCREEFSIVRLDGGLPELVLKSDWEKGAARKEFVFALKLSARPARESGALVLYTDHPQVPRIVVPMIARPGR